MSIEPQAIASLAKLREPFAEHHISKLPKESGQQADERKQNRNNGTNCKVCGGWHHKNAAHLDYVGHAAITHRLLDVDPAWSWEPLSVDERGLPAIDKDGGLWIKLTVCGVTRLGYGDAPRKTGGDAMKERIGDAIRNAAMRFGAALDLWHKGELHRPDDGDGAEHEQLKGPPAATFDVKAWIAKAQATTTDKDVMDVYHAGIKAASDAKDRAGYDAFKNAAVAHRAAIKARTADMPATEGAAA